MSMVFGKKSSGDEKIIEVDPDYFRPTEVQTLLGDASKVKEKLGWEPKISFRELVADMVQHDLELAKKSEPNELISSGHS